MIKNYPIYLVCALAFFLNPFSLDAHTHGHYGSLLRAHQLASDSSFSLQEAESRLQMKYAEGWQAGLWPNPLFSIALDEIPLSSAQSKNEPLEISVSITQLIELGNKRSARQNVIAAETYSLIWAKEALEQRHTYELKLAFNAHIKAQEKIKLLEKIDQNEALKLECASASAATGKALLIDQKKAFLARRGKASELYRARGESLDAARHLESISFLNLDEEQIGNKDYYALQPIPSIEECLELLEQNPEIIQRQYEQLASSYRHELQKALAISDVEMRAGIEKDCGIRGVKLQLGVSFQLPAYHRNQGGISGAAWEAQAFCHATAEKEKELTDRCKLVHNQLLYSLKTIETLKSDLIPRAQELVELHAERTKQAKQQCQETLQALSDLYDFEMQYIDALKEHHDLVAELNSICGIPLR